MINLQHRFEVYQQADIHGLSENGHRKNCCDEPIVGTPEDAFRCYMGNELDLLAIGDCIVQKSEQDGRLKRDYSLGLELD